MNGTFLFYGVEIVFNVEEVHIQWQEEVSEASVCYSQEEMK